MEEARQHPAVIPRQFAAFLFVLVMGELLSAFAIIVLAFVAPSHVFIAVNIFGLFLAARAAATVVYGLVRGMIFSRRRPICRVEHPIKFWLILTLNLLGIAIGGFLTQIPIK